MKEIKYYDNQYNRLVYIASGVNDSYWDEHWNIKDLRNFIMQQNNPMLLKYTKKYLLPGSFILEGGCGRGQNVYLLEREGYKAEGIDYAKKTIKKINKSFPELNVKEGDVRSLLYEDNTFDGYWSFGVIEHFYDGYDKIMHEMYRVIKPESILFMTVPTMSPLRMYKTKRGKYKDWTESAAGLDAFYQFALDPESIVNKFENNGFELLEKIPFDGLKGLKDEVFICKKQLQYIYDSNNLALKVIRKILDFLSRRFSSHMTLFVFKKKA